MVLIEFSIIPLDKGESLSSYVAQSLDIIARSGLAYRLNPMGTVIEGEYNEVMGVIKQCFEAMRQDCRRISLSLKMDYREGKESRLESKITSVEEKVGRELKK